VPLALRHSAVLFLLIFAAIFLLHWPLLGLPYFWDEAGYYIPAAHDLFLTGSLIPHSTPSNAHPPLVMAYLAAWWKVAGFSLFVTRTAMLIVAAFSLVGVFRLGKRVANLEVALAATACTALYPVFFAQSTMAHVDLAAAGLTLWGLEAYLGQRWRATVMCFSLAVLAKETAVLAPLGLLAWEIVTYLLPFGPLNGLARTMSMASPERCPDRKPFPRIQFASLAVPILVLCSWYGYHYASTGYVFGNPEFFRYNVQATMSGVRIVLALGMRLWQSFGYMHMWVLMLLMMWAMTRPALRDGDRERPRIAIPVQCLFAALILTYVAAMAVVGGAVLARYMLTVVPLVILVAVSTLWRRIRQWRWLVGLACIAFVLALLFNPPYGFAPEDNLAYRDYIVMHRQAESYLESHYPKARVLTAWPASAEISQPYLGYVAQPLQVLRVEDFSADEIMGAAQARSHFDVALVFSTKYEPHPTLFDRWRAWESIKTRFFGFHRDVPPVLAAQMLGGRVVFMRVNRGQWVAVIELDRVLDARLRGEPGRPAALAP
jgi:hypothetical protein